MSPVFDSDPLLNRLERRALIFCLGAAVVALALRGGRPDMAAAILAGGLLSGVSYWAIRSGVTSLTRLVAGGALRARAGAAAPVPAPAPGLPPDVPADVVAGPAPESDGDPQLLDASELGAPSKVALLLRLAGRYALLALMAYGMIARLRLHPIGLLIGMSSLVVAVSLEAIRPPTATRRDN